MRRKIAVISTCLILVLFAYLSIKKKLNIVSLDSSALAITTNVYDYISTIRTVASQSSGAPLVTFTNSAQKHFVKSFVCNLVLLGGPALASQLVVVVTDRETLDDLSSFNTDITVVLKPFMDGDYDLTYGTNKYEDYIEYRTSTILEVLNAGLSLILIDSDHYWLKSPLPWIRNQTGYDIIVENNSIPPAWSVCAGFLFLNSTVQTRAFWTKVDQHTKFFRSFTETKHINEQTVISRTLFEMWKKQQAALAKHDKVQRRQKRSWRGRGNQVGELWSIADRRFVAPEELKWDLFPLEKVVSGQWYTMMEFRAQFPEIWSVHNNWIMGNQEKLVRARQWNHWMLDEEKDICR